MAGTQFKVTIPNLDKLQSLMAHYPEIATPIVQSAIVASQALLAKHTTASTVPIKTGYLVQNWGFEAGNLQARWYPKAQYAPYVEFGTGIYGPKGQPYTIHNFFGRPGVSVQVKGQRPNPFMERILSAAQPEIESLFGQALEKITLAIAA